MSNDITPLTLGWTIVYVEDPVAASAFYAGTFGLTPSSRHPTAPTPSWTPARRSSRSRPTRWARATSPAASRRPDPDRPPNVEITLVTDDVDGATRVALDAGCTSLAEPVDKPHGQRVAFLRDPFGTLIEIGTPM